MPYMNNIRGTTLWADVTENGSYGDLYWLLDNMELQESKTYDIWGQNGMTYITFKEKRHAIYFMFNYPWSSGPKS